MFADLLAHPGVEEVCDLRSRFGLMAFHGGNLEPGTDEIAARAAERAGASLYAVVQPGDLYWHVPSVAFDPDVSPPLAAFVEHVDVVVALHGYGRQDMWTTLLAGGRNRGLAAQVAGALRRTLGDGFDVLDDLADIPRELRGLHRRNPVNLPRQAGVQLELPPRVRPGTGVPTHRPEYTDAIVDALVEVAGVTVGAGSATASLAEGGRHDDALADGRSAPARRSP